MLKISPNKNYAMVNTLTVDVTVEWSPHMATGPQEGGIVSII